MKDNGSIWEEKPDSAALSIEVGNGGYTVTFTADYTQCAFTAVPLNPLAVGITNPQTVHFSPTSTGASVFVRFTNTNEVDTFQDFELTVDC